ncbi:MAG: hypothetical protein HC841_00505 [Verrucomicrobiae bacterium]|nr:hypothetical protein [Verrucomicrobiae bacterium]
MITSECGRYWFDEDEADRCCDFFETELHLHTGVVQPFILEPWQRQIVRDLIGWKRLSDNLRRYREAYLEIPRKNGKSHLAAGIALWMLCCMGSQGPRSTRQRSLVSKRNTSSTPLSRWSPRTTSSARNVRSSVAKMPTESSTGIRTTSHWLPRPERFTVRTLTA